MSGSIPSTAALVFLLSLLAILTIAPLAVAAGTSEVSKFCVSQVSPKELSPAEQRGVEISIRNLGTTEVYHVAVEVLAIESPIKILGATRKEIGTVAGGKEASVTYEVYVDKEADVGVYYIPLRVFWRDEWGEEGELCSETIYFSLRVTGSLKRAEIEVLSVETVPEVVKPGDTFSLKIRLKNVGISDARALRANISVSSPFMPVGGDVEEYLGVLKSGEETLVTFNLSVAADAHTSQHIFELTLRYEDETSRNNVERKEIGVFVRGEPSVYIQEITLEPSNLQQGSEGILMLKLTNVGTENAEDVRVEVSSVGLLSESYYFIGEIPPDSSETAAFGVYVDDDAKVGMYALKINVHYNDRFGKEYSYTRIYEVRVLEKAPLIPLSYVVAFSVIAIALLAGVYFVQRREDEG